MSQQDDNAGVGRRKLLGSTASVAAAAGFAGAGAAALVAPAQAQQR